MYQYYINKEESNIDYLKFNILFRNRLFANSPLEKGYNYKNINVDRCTFSKLSFYLTRIEESKFTYCTFIDCYFKESDLDNILFRNCIFINCSFSDNKIENCIFEYCEWKSTVIKYDELYKSFPKKHNHRSKLCKVMAQGFLEESNIAEYRKYFFKSIEAREKHYKEIILRREAYYKKYYKFKDSLMHIPKLILSKISGIFWGHGEKIRHILFSSIIVILLFAIIYSYSATIEGNGINRYFNALYPSICYFLSISSDVTFFESLYRNITILESFIGIIFSGLFITALIKKMNLR